MQSYLGEKQGKIEFLIANSMAANNIPEIEFPENGRPRPYVSQVFLLLAAVQTEISDVSRVLMRPLMSQLATGLFGQMLSAIRAIRPPIPAALLIQLDAELAIFEEILATGMSEEASELAGAAHSALITLQSISPETKNIKFVRFNCIASMARQYSSFQYT